jgi:flagellar capping protein FliD
MAADMTNSAGVTAFLGGAETGGFLKWATNSLESINNSSSGLIKTAEAALTAQKDATNAQIAAKQEQIDRLQQRLQAQMAAADAAIATLEQQYTYFSNMFQAQNTAQQQY